MLHKNRVYTIFSTFLNSLSDLHDDWTFWHLTGADNTNQFRQEIESCSSREDSQSTW
jgi:hypothetical protein